MKLFDIKPRRITLLALPLILLLLLLPPSIYYLLNHYLPLQQQLRLSDANTTSTCAYSIVYNKPHKTAGTKIQSDIVKWANKTHWTAITCDAHEPNIQMRECIPDSRDGCVIVATHMVLDDALKELLRSKLGDNIIWMTSTRSGRERRVSHFLQKYRIRHSKADLDDLKSYMVSANPWSDYNYMTGELLSGSCPLKRTDQKRINTLVTKYEIVIDATLPKISNKILKHYGIFQLTDSRVNVKGAKKLELDEEAEELVRNISCVDEEMHRQFRIRMGSLYQKITGVRCNSRSRVVTPCF